MLGINGSPRPYGLTSMLLEACLKGAKEAGANIERVDLYDLDIQPCIGCLCDEEKACRYPCLIEDDMRKLYDKVLKADGIILATPIYWFMPSGVIKNFIDRLTALENMIVIGDKSWVEGKVAGIVAAGNDHGAIQVIAPIMTALVSMGFMIPPFAMAYYVAKNDEPSDDSLMDAYNLGRNIAILASLRKGYTSSWYKVLEESELNELRKAVITKAKRLKRLKMPERKALIRKFLQEAGVRVSQRTRKARSSGLS